MTEARRVELVMIISNHPVSNEREWNIFFIIKSNQEILKILLIYKTNRRFNRRYFLGMV